MPPDRHFELMMLHATVMARGGTLSAANTDEQNSKYCNACEHFCQRTGTHFIVSYDESCIVDERLADQGFGYCLHMSISYKNFTYDGDKAIMEKKIDDPTITAKWLEALFGEDLDDVWQFDSRTPIGKRWSVRHYILFVDESRERKQISNAQVSLLQASEMTLRKQLTPKT